jgi:protease-4
MFSLLTGVPGVDELRAVVRKVDTVRHHGVPDGCVLELDLQSVPHEAAGFDPLAMIAGGGGRCCCARRWPPSTAPPRTTGSRA